MKNLIVLMLVMSFYSCSTLKKPVEQPSISPPVPVEQPVDEVIHDSDEDLTAQPIGDAYPVKDVKKVFTVNIKDTNYTAKQKTNLKAAAKIIEAVMNSREYKELVLSHTNKKGAKLFDSNRGLSNQQIYDKLFKGAESLIPAVDYEMDLTVTMYYSWYSKVVGWTNGKIMTVHTNSKYHNKYTACSIASNLIHEWTHKMGFDHVSASSSYSVPYAHNSILRSL